MEECLKLKRSDIAALDSQITTLIVVQQRALVILATLRVTPVDRWAAELQGVGGGWTAVVFEST